LVASGSEDGTVRLVHVTNQRALALFVHTLPQSIDEPEDEGKHQEDYDDDDVYDEEEDNDEPREESNRPAQRADANRGNVIVEDEEIDVSEEDEGEEKEFVEASQSVER